PPKHENATCDREEAILYLKENSATITFSSHQMANVEEICEDICMMKKGGVLLEGNLDILRRYTGVCV
ncbi:hypothetical protein OCL90_14800, partial [Enterococcus faecalis]|nr:hypothetical protein [Enterococcus faecalis]